MPHTHPQATPHRAIRRALLLAPLLGFLTLTLQGCPGVFIAGAATGAAVIHDRRSAGTVLDDQRIELEAMQDLYNDASIRDNTSISVTSYDYVALLTGQANAAEFSQRAADRVARIRNVKRVINEVTIGPSATFTEEAQAYYVTIHAKAALTGVDLPTFDPSRVKVVTEKGVVYLMGLVTRQEADAAVEKVRYVSGVSKVVKVFDYITDAQ